MDQFECHYLVCLDYGDDINYVVARNPDLAVAESIANEARDKWPGKEVYITVEKIPRINPLSEDVIGGKICICGKTSGSCIGQLSCRCNALAICKRIEDDVDPMDYEKHHGFRKPMLTEVDIYVVDVKRVINIRIPAWDDRTVFGLPPSDFDEYTLAQLRPGTRLRARVSLNADDVNDLLIEDIELA